MDLRLSRRGLLQTAALATAWIASTRPVSALPRNRREQAEGWVSGHMTGAQVVVAALKQMGTTAVFGIPGAQENELWDVFKTEHIPYLLVTHEFSAACMADGFARSTGRPGVMAIVPGPGVTNSLSGLGEALLDSVPIVAIVGDVGNHDKAHAFQVHSLDQVALLKPVTKCVLHVERVEEIPGAIQQAFTLAMSGEPGPVAVVIPYNLLIDAADFHLPPPAAPDLLWDEAAAERAMAILRHRKLRVGIYAGQGTMACADLVVQAAELLQAPVATSISGKGVMPENHALAVGWGYGPQGTRTAELVFGEIDCLLAIGVRYSEVATGYYSNHRPKYMIHVDANPANMGRVIKPDVCVPADAGLFLNHLLSQPDCLRRSPDPAMRAHIHRLKCTDREVWAKNYGQCGVDPMAIILALRRNMADDALLFTDVMLAEHLAAEAFTVTRPRTYFNPTDNQAMGWSIPAALGAQFGCPNQTVVTLTGDGCFLMSALESSTAARAGLPVKFFVLDNQAYKYMQALQQPAYQRTNATILAKLDYASLANAFGLGYAEITSCGGLDAQVRDVMNQPRPVLIRVVTDYGDRPIRWIEAVRKKYTKELTTGQKARFLARAGSRAMHVKPPQND
ncbi:MAG: thiamine pyrophosphate-binding protein [Gemmataceae bacterium]